ncbi:putative ribonuclease H-like domain-containing protein [Tanacetum coccineum]|uniref:Ribonuclease H-like domain-containing protein n=1 Tax=Tanacetum coccineum TaxID=301880 RepID=A0ABQ5AYW5_9ASTR
MLLKGSQISDNSRKGVGYNAVPPPPTGLFAPLTIDLSTHVVLEEFIQPVFSRLWTYGQMLLRPQHVGFGDLRNLIGIPPTDDQGYVDSGCSRHMISNISYLLDFQEFDRGYVTFGGGVRGGKITCKDESQILLKIPRKNNMYSVDMKKIIPKESLTCLVAKVTLDESMLWHRRLGHINFKTINKLVKDNLVRDSIGCDNGTEFKNRVINKFCKQKAIKREYSVARTPQQNGVAQRINRTLIEAARTMLADSKLPTTFWAEAVNIACYVQNRKDKGGIVIRNKARLVAQGYTQEEGIDYDEPPGFEDPDNPDKVYKIVKALYGLHQAPRAWYETLAKYLLDNGFHRGKIDQTLFIKKQKGDILLVHVYVDDILLSTKE